MRVAVIGAGIIGITTAYELALDGHEVNVIERRSAAAEEGSFAHAGLIAPGGAERLSSLSVFHCPHDPHWPDHLPWTVPQD